MKIINIQAAKTHLSRLVEEAASGETVVIAKAGKPIATLSAFQPKSEARVLGALAGQVWESPDCWEPDPDLEKALYGEADWTGPTLKIAEDPHEPAP